ncbi:MAG: TonB-dependent receptor, partial [Cyclobacteriaceae bacterium]|nr:TonB-dependent receptor [Cyclobacteriaceae bacterium]
GSISDALKQIPADEIKSVEVITAPSARYDAEGTGGIINIITKKNNLEGGTLSVNSGIGWRSSMMHLNAGYRKRKMGYSLGGFGRAGYNIKGEYQNEQSVKDDLGSVISNTLQKAESSTNMMIGRYKFGWDYTPNKYNWLGSTVNFGLFNFKMAQFDRLSQKSIAAMTESSVDDVTMDNLSNTVDASLNYIRTFEEKGKEISLLSLYSQNARTNDFSIENLSSDVPALYEATLNENKSFNREMTVQLDYVEPMGEKVKLEAGLKNIMRIVTSDYQYMVRPTGGTFMVLDGVNFNDVLDYRQNVAAGYFSGMFELPKGFGIQAGGRYEYTSIEADLQNEGGLDIPDYGIFVPSINLSKKIGQGKTLKFSFSQRIQRPSLQFLNPSRDASNPLNISQGNPLLQPEYNNNYEASFNTFSKGSAISVTGFARNTNGAIQRVREPIGQDTILTTYRNIGDEDAYGASIFGNLNKGKLSLGGGVDGYYAILNNNIDDPKYRGYNEGFVISGRVFGSYKLTELWAFQLFSFFRGNQIQLQGYQTSFYIYSLSLNRSFKDKKGSIGFGAENFLNQYMRMVTKVYSPSVDQFNTNLMRTLNFKINLSYRIGKLNMAQDRRRNKSINNDDLKDGGDSQGGGMMQN